MKDWFTVEKIDNETFAISEYKHIEKSHSYLVIGKKRALLIDTGLGVGNIREEAEKLTDLDITVISTHVHWDHVGGHILFDRYLVHEREAKWITEKPFYTLECIKNNLKRGATEFPEEFNIDDYKMFKKQPDGIIKDNDILDLGGRKLRIIHTPGHSPGHICIYDIEREYLFTGDLIYKGTLYAFFPTSDPVEYMHSVAKIKDLEVKKILPGHGDLDVPVDIIKRTYKAFEEIDEDGLLKHGSGSFDFGDFRILL